MANRAHVPKFGNWESEDDVPYTVVFDKARKGKGRGGKMINPNDPQENPEMFSKFPSSDSTSSRSKLQAQEPMGRAAARTTHDQQRRMSREDEKITGNYGHGSNSGRPSRQSIGSEHSLEKSPLHPHYQAKARGAGPAAGGGSPAWEGKNSYDNSSHGTPGRSRMKPVARVDESPDRGAAVPRFGEWDENNPQSADNYTHIFNKVREERQTGSSSAPGAKSDSSYYGMQKPKDSKGCCFPFLKK